MSQMLPGRRTLATEYGVALTTIERAVATLVSEGWLRADDRRGTFVARMAEGIGRDSGPAPQTPRPDPLHATIGIIATVVRWRSEEEERAQWPMRLLNACEHRLSANPGLTVRYVNTVDSGSDQAAALASVNRLLEQPVDVAVLLAQQFAPPMLARLDRREIPAIVASYDVLDVPAPQVNIDGVSGGAQAMQHLLLRHYQPVVFFAPHAGVWVQARHSGASAAAVRAGLDARQFRAEIAGGETAEALSREQVSALTVERATRFVEGLERGAGVIAANDGAAVAVMDAAARRGLEAGRDYGIVGFDDRRRDRGLTSLRPPLEAMGEEAARLAEAIVQGGTPPTRVLLRHQLIARESTRRGDAREVAAS